jgi:hypothetical protein
MRSELISGDGLARARAVPQCLSRDHERAGEPHADKSCFEQQLTTFDFENFSASS